MNSLLRIMSQLSYFMILGAFISLNCIQIINNTGQYAQIIEYIDQVYFKIIKLSKKINIKSSQKKKHEEMKILGYHNMLISNNFEITSSSYTNKTLQTPKGSIKQLNEKLSKISQ
ncbi:unnamed protein product [Paramecium sonneborni]|uniref:Uncharacterized protein n=1 Tax=Paramecium sonneborni TaxID=65129 RepID=A0A8S1M287_9CILI|nr:unnamed protein product [Paramecium sonneborni]